jgi:alpha-galactosidase
MDLAQLKPVEERELRAQIKFYKAHRETFQFGTFRRLAAGNDETGWQTAGEGETIAGFFSRLVPAAPGYETRRLKNLDPGKVYRVETISVRLRVGDFGGLVKYVSPVRVAPDGLLARTADRLYSLPDGGVSFAASGAALMAGFAPAPRFTGTGYDKNARNQGDFGSELYIVSEGKNHDKHR